MKRAVVTYSSAYGTDMRITRYVGTGTVNVHEMDSLTQDTICKYTCSVGDLPKEAQAFLDMCGLGCSKNRRKSCKKHKCKTGLFPCSESDGECIFYAGGDNL